MESLRGHLLIGGSGPWGPHFRRRRGRVGRPARQGGGGAAPSAPHCRRPVVLTGPPDEEGAVGVALNQPLDTTVEEAAPPLSPLVPPGESLFRGAPVQPEAAVVLADFEDPDRAGVLALDTIGFLPEESDTESLGGL